MHNTYIRSYDKDTHMHTHACGTYSLSLSLSHTHTHIHTFTQSEREKEKEREGRACAHTYTQTHQKRSLRRILNHLVDPTEVELEWRPYIVEEEDEHTESGCDCKCKSVVAAKLFGQRPTRHQVVVGVVICEPFVLLLHAIEKVHVAYDNQDCVPHMVKQRVPGWQSDSIWVYV